MTPATIATLFIAAALLATPARAAPTPAGPAIRIGQLTSRTGNNPAGHDGEDGARQAIAELNVAGGLLGGRPLELVVEDDRTDVAAGMAAFDRLAAARVGAIVGSSFSNVSLAVIPQVERAGIPYLSTGAADGQVEPVRPAMFMTSLPGRLVGAQLLRFLHARGVTRLAVIYDTDSRFARSGWDLQRGMLAEHGIVLANESAVHVRTTDFAGPIAAIRAGGAQAVMAWLTGPPAIAFVHAWHDAHGHLPVVMSHGAASRSFVTAAGAAADGIFVATSLAVVADQAPATPVGREARSLARRFQAAWGHPPSQFAVDAYVAVRLIAAAIARAGSDDPTAIRAALEGAALPTAQGVYRFTAANHSGLAVDDIAIARITAGRFVLTDWSRRQFAMPHPQGEAR